jgi:hypothetical protein
MAALALRILAATLLERDDFGATRLSDDFADDLCSSDQWGAELDIVSVGEHQHVGESDFLAGFAGKRHNYNFFIGDNAILLAAGFDDCEHRFLSVFIPAIEFPRRPAF